MNICKEIKEMMGSVGEAKEVFYVHINFLNKEKNHKKDIKVFSGKNFMDAHKKASVWGNKNIDKFNADTIIDGKE